MAVIHLSETNLWPIGIRIFTSIEKHACRAYTVAESVCVCGCGLLLIDRGKPWNVEIGSSSSLCKDTFLDTNTKAVATV